MRGKLEPVLRLEPVLESEMQLGPKSMSALTLEPLVKMMMMMILESKSVCELAKSPSEKLEPEGVGEPERVSE